MSSSSGASAAAVKGPTPARDAKKGSKSSASEKKINANENRSKVRFFYISLEPTAHLRFLCSMPRNFEDTTPNIRLRVLSFRYQTNQQI